MTVRIVVVTDFNWSKCNLAFPVLLLYLPYGWSERPVSCLFAESVSVTPADCCVMAIISVSIFKILDFSYNWVPLSLCLNVMNLVGCLPIRWNLSVLMYICHIVSVLYLILRIRFFISSSVYCYNLICTNNSMCTLICNSCLKIRDKSKKKHCS